MALDDLNKDHSGLGNIKYWKDIYPERLTTLYVYKGTNLNHRGKDIFSREDDISIISLEKIDEIVGIFGGLALAEVPRTNEEEKQIKELLLENVPSEGFTAFMSELKYDYKDQNIFFTLGQEFIQGDINQENLSVYKSINTNPNNFQKFIGGTTTIDYKRDELIQETISYTLSPAILQNNLQSSKVIFVDADIYKPLPNEEKDFEITSIEVETDQTFIGEFGNWIQGKGIIETQSNIEEEIDIDFKSDKPFSPIKVSPYAKNGKLQFAIDNFNKYQRMPWLYAKKFLGTNRSIAEYISLGNSATWVTELTTAIVDMFKLSHAFTTNFAEYRDSSGEINNDTIGGVALKALEGKGGVEDVDAILKTWEYKNGLKKKTPEYIRALQILSASSEWVLSSCNIML